MKNVVHFCFVLFKERVEIVKLHLSGFRRRDLSNYGILTLHREFAGVLLMATIKNVDSKQRCDF